LCLGLCQRRLRTTIIVHTFAFCNLISDDKGICRVQRCRHLPEVLPPACCILQIFESIVLGIEVEVKER